MKKILFVLVMMITFTTFSQKKYTLSGQLQFDSFHIGGAYREHIPNPRPLANYSLLLVKFVEGDSIPKVVKTFQSDEDGHFKISVLPGKYGFVAVNDSIVAHQCIPTAHFSQSEMMNSSSSTWTLNGDSNPTPIVVTDADVGTITLLNFNYSSCGMCP